jgi:uncharacterized protein involved in high-affinity Fe2+ transport
MRAQLPFSLALLLVATFAQAKEYPIGEPQQCGGLEVGAVYLQPIEMDPPGMMRPAADSDVHLEADISALENNPNGFQEGSFVPYLNIAFVLRKEGSDEVLEGDFHAMVANDGPHYGDNLKLSGPGKYHLTFSVLPPAGDHGMFGRHTDKETGVAPWFERCDLSYEFTYAGIGKKGGY